MDNTLLLCFGLVAVTAGCAVAAQRMGVPPSILLVLATSLGFLVLRWLEIRRAHQLGVVANPRSVFLKTLFPVIDAFFESRLRRGHLFACSRELSLLLLRRQQERRRRHLGPVVIQAVFIDRIKERRQ